MKRLFIHACVGLLLPEASLGSLGPSAQPRLSPAAPLSDGALDKEVRSSQQLKLLDMAFSGVSKMPVKPHIKNRSRSQQQVVEAALELGRPEQAERYIRHIQNWQHWMGCANLAFFYAQHGRRHLARKSLRYAEAALEMSERLRSGSIVTTGPNPLIDSLKGWRFRQVKARVDETHWLLSLTPLANAVGGMADRQVQDWGASMSVLRTIPRHIGFEVMAETLAGMAKLADECCAAADIGRLLEIDILPRMERTPIFFQIDVLNSLAEICVRRGDNQRAMEIVACTESLINHQLLAPRFFISETAKLIVLRFKVAVKSQAATRDIDHLMEYYRDKRGVIVNIDRASLVCRMAEIYHLIGMKDTALDIYSQAIDEAMVNPNSRPRSQDICSICCSLALNNVKPSDALLVKLEKAISQLGSPW